MEKLFLFRFRFLTVILLAFLASNLLTPDGSCYAQGSIDHSFNPGDIGFGNGDGASNTVWATTLQQDGKIIIGGGFNSYNGTVISRIARLNTDGKLDNTFNSGTGVNGYVYTTALQPDGKIIIGGYFTSYNGTVRNRIARLNADGTLDNTFNPGTGANGDVRTTTLQSDGKIIIGGYFTSYNGTVRNRIARLNTDGTLDNTFNPGTGVNSYVYTTALQSNGKIIIGGNFTSCNGTIRNRIARLNADGSLDNTFNPGTGADNSIYTTALQSNGKIIIGGEFASYNGTGRNRIARLNTDGSLDIPFNPGTGADSWVFTTALQSNGKIIIGGNFTSYNGTTINRIARLNADGSLDNTFNQGTGANNIVRTTTLQNDGKILIGGQFTFYSGTGRNRIARLNADGSFDNTFNPGTGANYIVRTNAIQNDGKIIIGGEFNYFNGTVINSIARLNANGSLDTTFNPGTGANNTVLACAIQSDGKILIGGQFTFYNGVARNRIARLNADGSLDTTFNPGFGASSSVWTTTLQSDGKILIGGNFTSYNGTGRSYIARLNTNGSLDITFNHVSGANSTVFTTALQSDGKIIIGGDFTSYNGTGINRIARLNADGSLDNTFNPGTGANNIVFTSALQSNGEIIIGGNFTTYNGTTRNRIIRLNADGSLDSTFNPGTGAIGWIYTTSLQSNGKIIIGGGLSSYNGTARNRIARLNTDGSLDTTFNPGTGANNFVYTTALQPDGKIIIGGDFTSYNGTGRNRIARILNCTSAISYDVHTACNSFTWMNGITYTSSNNTAVYNIVGGAANGCDSVVMLNLTINAPTVTITALGNISFCQGDSVMLAAQSNAITHQWYRNGVAIPNATGTTYVVKTAGRYRCIGNISSACSDTSNIIFVSVPCTPLDPPVDRIMQNDYSVQHVVISPNPATHTLSLKFDFAVLNGFELELLDLYGKLVLRQYFQNAGEEFTFSLPDHIANGMYICRITTPEMNVSSKVIVER